MWRNLSVPGELLTQKWVRHDDAGRILGRVLLKDGEYVASKVEVDPEGVGHSKSKGCYISLELAQAAIEINS